MTPGPWWLVLWLPLLATLPAGAVQEEEAVMAAPRCKSLKEADLIETSVSDCYCYNQESQIEWAYMWSTVQVTIASQGLLRFVYITGSHNCQHPETILSFVKCLIHNFWAPEEFKGLIMVFSPYGETVCFSVKPIGRVSTYIVSVDRNTVDLRLLLLFVAGTLLFFSAKTLSQTHVQHHLIRSHECQDSCSCFLMLGACCPFSDIGRDRSRFLEKPCFLLLFGYCVRCAHDSSLCPSDG